MVLEVAEDGSTSCMSELPLLRGSNSESGHDEGIRFPLEAQSDEIEWKIPSMRCLMLRPPDLKSDLACHVTSGPRVMSVRTHDSDFVAKFHVE